MLLLATVYVVVNLAADLLTVFLVPAAPDAPGMSSTALAAGRGRRFGAGGWTALIAGSLRFGRTRVGLSLLAFVVAIAVVGPFFAPHAPDALVGLPSQSPSGAFPLGTDYLGHDVLSRVLWGGRSVVWMAFAAATLGVGLGAAAGILAAYSRPLLDDALMRGMDVILAFPQIVFVLLFVSLLGPRLWLIVLLVAFSWVPQVARVARGIAVGGRAPRVRRVGRGARALAAPHPRARDPAQRDDAAARRVRPAAHVVDRVDRRRQLPRLRHPAAACRLGPDDQREPDGLTVQPWAVIVPAACIALFAVGTNFVTEGLARAIAGIDRRERAR